MLATPLSISIAAGVSASTSEIRAPLHKRVRQKSRTAARCRAVARNEALALDGVEIFSMTGEFEKA
jgi:hypothetical protein